MPTFRAEPNVLPRRRYFDGVAIRVLQVMAASAGGIARHVAHVTAALAEEGTFDIDIDIAGVRPPIPLPKDLIEVAIPPGMWGHKAAQAGLRRVLRGGAYDVVHAHGLRAAVDAAMAARGGPPVVATVHNLVRADVSGRVRAPMYARAEALTVSLCAKVFGVSEQISRHLRGRSPRHAAKIETLYLGIGDPPHISRNQKEVRKELDAGSSAVVLTASRLAPQKALHVLLGAIAEIRPAPVLAVAGTGPLQTKLQELSADLGVEDRVRWLGFRDDVHDLIAAADVFCLSSTWEGVPLAAQEAMLLGTPVVATAVGGIPELIDDGVSGRLAPPGDPGALAAALHEVLDDPDLQRRYATAARAQIRQKFSTQRMLTTLSRTYEELAGAG